MGNGLVSESDVLANRISRKDIEGDKRDIIHQKKKRGHWQSGNQPYFGSKFCWETFIILCSILVQVSPDAYNYKTRTPYK